MKKAGIIIMGILLAAILIGCREKEADGINLISREAGSGTRDAFTQLIGIKKDGRDYTADTSEVTSSAFVAITSVAGDKNAVSYVSFGILSDKVKAVKIDGIAAEAENVRNGSYPLARTFNIVDSGDMTAETRDFMNFIFSSEGQAIIKEKGYIPTGDETRQANITAETNRRREAAAERRVYESRRYKKSDKSEEAGRRKASEAEKKRHEKKENGADLRPKENIRETLSKNYSEEKSLGSYTPKGLSGRITAAGSTSVAPLIDALADRYKELNPDIEIEIQQTGSGTGITSVLEGACDIGMSSRELNERETGRGAKATAIARDGIAVIVNPLNNVENLSREEIKKIFTGEKRSWE